MSDRPAKPFKEDYAREVDRGMRGAARTEISLDAQFIFARVINIYTRIKTFLCN